jgi:hypothetical protein
MRGDPAPIRGWSRRSIGPLSPRAEASRNSSRCRPFATRLSVTPVWHGVWPRRAHNVERTIDGSESSPFPSVKSKPDGLGVHLPSGPRQNPSHDSDPSPRNTNGFFWIAVSAMRILRHSISSDRPAGRTDEVLAACGNGHVLRPPAIWTSGGDTRTDCRRHAWCGRTISWKRAQPLPPAIGNVFVTP